MGLHPSIIIQGYKLALDEAIKVLESQVSLNVNDIHNETIVVKLIEASLAPKLPNSY